jgi:Sulfotransferase domain
MMISSTDIDFLIVGAAKSATTWLQRSLQSDPSVYMPDPELHFFSREFHRELNWYLEQFTPHRGAVLIGEKSNSYLDTPESVFRIAYDLPHVNIVVQLRNPVDRAYSDYCMFYRRGQVNRDIERHLDPTGERTTRILDAGLYSQQLAAFYERFPGRVLVMFYENMIADPASHLASVREFLGLDPHTPFRVPGKVKDKTTPMLSPSVRRIFGPLKPIVAPFRKTAAFRRLHGALSQEIRYAPLPGHLRRRLVDYYSQDLDNLERLTGADLGRWLHGEPVPRRYVPARSPELAAGDFTDIP